ncbi:MAG: ATP-grasp domain-containing protein, partial [Chloroflexota bacterium]
NEIAPRVHNSGHWTIEGADTSQFANHVRAVMGLPLGSVAARGYAAMANILGSCPPLSTLLAMPDAYVHLYGKEPTTGRKLGHVTIVRQSEAAAREGLEQIRAALAQARAWAQDSPSGRTGSGHGSL